jgi:hypothetical protein
MAQGGGGRGQGMRMMGGGDSSGMQLLFGNPRQPARKDVQTDLNLTDDQKSKLEAAGQKMMDDFRAMFQGGGGQPDQDAIKKVMDTAKAEVAKILTKEQTARLREINIQLVGTSAAMFPDVQKDLGLTDDQKTKLKDLQTKQGEAMQALRQKMRDQEITMEEFQDANKKNNDTMKTEIGKVLTADQQTKLKAMGGKEFKADKAG